MSGQSWNTRFRWYGRLHAYAFFSSLGRLARSPLGASMNVLVVGITLALPTAFHLAVDNLQRVGAGFTPSNQLSVFLRMEVSDDSGLALAQVLERDGRIQRARFVSREEALAEFRAYSGFGEAIDALDSNPLPALIEIQPVSGLGAPADLMRFIQELQKRPEIDFVKLDMEWLERLNALMGMMQRVVLMLSILFACAVVFIVGNTINLELQDRRDEVEVSKLMGARDGFVRRPFLYTGLWVGLLGSALASVLVGSMLLFVRGPVHRLASLYQSAFQLQYLGQQELIALILVGSLSGVLGAWLAVARHLRSVKRR